MPPLAIGAVIAAAAYAAGATLAVVSLAFSVGAFIGSMIFKPKAPQAPDIPKQQLSDRTQIIRSAIEGHRIVYGTVRVSGTLVFAHVIKTPAPTEDAYRGQEYDYDLYMVIALAGHECQEMVGLYLNDEWVRLVTVDEGFGQELVPAFDGGDNPPSWRSYYGYFWCKFYNGGGDNASADPRLVARLPGLWSTSHKLNGICYLMVNMRFKRDVYPGGIPNVSVVLKGKKIYDPRTATTYFNNNPALCMRDLLTSYLKVTSAEIDDTSFTAVANNCDEEVTVSQEKVFLSLFVDRQYFQLANHADNFATGDKVRVSSTGTLPSPLSAGTDYYYIFLTEDYFRLATTYSNALTGTYQSIASDGSGTFTLSKQTHKRYTCDGTFTLEDAPISSIESILSSFAGNITWQQGVFTLWGGKYETPTISISEEDLRDKVKVRTRVPRRELFNAVRGTFSDPAKFWAASEFPPIRNSTYETQDGSERIYGDLVLPFTTDRVRAQRLAKIYLERSRQSLNVEWPGKLTLLRVKCGDVIEVTHAALGWSGKAFRVAEWKINTEGGIDLVLQEEASASYTWSSEETRFDPAPNTNLPKPTARGTPGVPDISEELYSSRGFGVKCRVIAEWGPPSESMFYTKSYKFEYKLSSAGGGAWQVIQTTGRRIELPDIAPGIYDFRVAAANYYDAYGDYATLSNKQIIGVSAPPSAVEGFYLQAVSNIAILHWNEHEDLDVLEGGGFRIRWTAETASPSWTDAIDVLGGQLVPGNARSITVPLIAGSYLIKAIDASGNESIDFASISTNAAVLLNFSPVGVVEEHNDVPDPFAGTKVGMFLDTTTSPDELRLTNETMFDDYPLIDSVTDFLDGIGGFVTFGSYTFNDGIDSGSVKTVRLTVGITATIFNDNDRIDERGLVDEWGDIDGIIGAPIDIRFFVRQTDDDPAGTPTWSGWTPLMMGDYRARAYQFMITVASTNTTYNVAITELSATAEEVV